MTAAPNSPNEVENPMINSPFAEPRCHWQIERARQRVKAPGRRPASYFYRTGWLGRSAVLSPWSDRGRHRNLPRLR